MASSLKKINVKLDLLTDIYLLLMVEKSIRGGICYAIYGYLTAKNKYMKNYDENKESLNLKYWDVNNLYGWAISQKLLVNDFNGVKDRFQFINDFIENYNEDNSEGYFIEVDVQYLENLHNLHNCVPF